MISTLARRVGLVEAADHVALARRGRIAGRGHHDRHGPVVRPVELVPSRGRPAARQRSSASSRSLRSRGSTACVSGSPKRQLNSSTFGPAAVIIRPAYRTPRYGRAASRAARRRPAGERSSTISAQRSASMPGHGRVAAHAAGVRPGVALADPLVVLGGRHRHDALAVAEREQRQLLALEELLDAPRARRPRRSGARRRSRAAPRAPRAGLPAITRPCRRPARRPSARRGRRRSPSAPRPARRSRTRRGTAVGTPASRISSFANALLPSRRAASARGPNARRPSASSASTRPATSGASGPTTVRSTRSSRREAHEPVDVLGGDVEAARVRARCRRCRARRAPPAARAAQQRAHDRVLAASAADDQHSLAGALTASAGTRRSRRSRRRARRTARARRCLATSPTSTP